MLLFTFLLALALCQTASLATGGVFFDIPDFLHTPLAHLEEHRKHSGKYSSPDGLVMLHHEVEFHPIVIFL